MRLTYKAFDGRRWNHREIIDEDTGRMVGIIRSSGRPYGHGIHVSLFGKYKSTIHSGEECWGFVKGVEAVLNHMTTADFSEFATQAGDSNAA